MSKTLTVKQTGWKVSGCLYVSLWDGSKGTIETGTCLIPAGELTKRTLLSCLKDNYGAQHLHYAWVLVTEMYEMRAEHIRCAIYFENTGERWEIRDAEEIPIKVRQCFWDSGL